MKVFLKMKQFEIQGLKIIITPLGSRKKRVRELSTDDLFNLLQLFNSIEDRPMEVVFKLREILANKFYVKYMNNREKLEKLKS